MSLHDHHVSKHTTSKNNRQDWMKATVGPDLRQQPQRSRVVYALTSGGRDRFSAMTRVSISSLRVTNEQVSVCVVCDSITVAALKRSRDPLLNEIDELIDCQTPAGDAAYRNRHMKTRLRQILDGPFLFLDSDTFVRGNLSEIFSHDADIAGVINHCSDAPVDQIAARDTQALARMNWRIGDRGYINGGVLYFNNTEPAYRTGCLWHDKWLRSVEDCAKYHDQAALNAALFAAKPDLKILPHKFNAQFRVAPHVVENAVIWHFYESVRYPPPMTSFEVLVERMCKEQGAHRDIVMAMVRQSRPWRRKARLHYMLAKVLPFYDPLAPGFGGWFQS